MIIGSEAVFLRTQLCAFHMRQKWASLIGQITPNNQAGSADTVEILSALDKVRDL